MKYLLDTNTVSELMKNNPHTWELLLTKSPGDIHLCEIVIAEIYYGLNRLGNTKKRRLLEQEFSPLISTIQTLKWDRETSEKFGIIKADLSLKGTIVPDMDIGIAAHALRHQCILVTDNIADFERIVGLKIINWKE